MGSAGHCYGFSRATPARIAQHPPAMFPSPAVAGGSVSAAYLVADSCLYSCIPQAIFIRTRIKFNSWRSHHSTWRAPGGPVGFDSQRQCSGAHTTGHTPTGRKLQPTRSPISQVFCCITAKYCFLVAMSVYTWQFSQGAWKASPIRQVFY